MKLLTTLREQASDPKLQYVSLPSNVVMALVDVARAALDEQQEIAPPHSVELSDALDKLQLAGAHL